MGEEGEEDKVGEGVQPSREVAVVLWRRMGSEPLGPAEALAGRSERCTLTTERASRRCVSPYVVVTVVSLPVSLLLRRLLGSSVEVSKGHERERLRAWAAT